MTDPVDLTPVQRKMLRNFRDYCAAPPTLAVVYGKSLAAIAILVIYFAGAVAMFLALDQEMVAVLFAGIGVGILFQQFLSVRAFLRVWPAVDLVLDRDRLADLLQEVPAGPEPDNWS